MSATKRTASRKSRRPAVNLSLSTLAIRQGRELQSQMNRPSLSNVVEHLIIEAAKAQQQQEAQA